MRIKAIRIFAFAAFVLICTRGWAAPSDVIAIMSLVGDEVSVVTRASDTGVTVNKRNVETLPSQGNGLDQLALASAASAIELKDHDASTVLLGLKDAALYQDQFAALLNGEPDGAPQWLRTVVASKGITKILVFTKYRGPALFESDIGGVGSGNVRGLGFFMDFDQVNSNLNSRGQHGYLAPYAYLTATLIDARTFKILGQHIETQSDVIWVAASKGSFPWDVLDNDEKIEAIRSLVKKAAAKGAALVM